MVTLNSHSVICLNDNVLNMLVSSMEKMNGEFSFDQKKVQEKTDCPLNGNKITCCTIPILLVFKKD